MKKISSELEFFINLAKAKAVIARRFDNRLSFQGVGFSDFMVLFYLNQVPEGKMRRIDLAEKMGLTASGITRMLLPMEKIGLVKREINEHDARVSYVMLASGGKRLYEEGLERAELLVEELFPKSKIKSLPEFSDLLTELGKTVIY